MGPYWLTTLGAETFTAPPTLPVSADTVVIGGGLMGVATLYWLARAGRQPVLIEAEDLCSGATGRNAGLLLPNSSPLEQPALLRSVLAEEQIDAGFATPGHLALAASASCWDAFQAEASRSQARGGTLEALDIPACERLIGTRLSGLFLGGRWYPGGGLVHSARLVHGLARAAERYGATVAIRTRARAVTNEPGTDRLLVETNRGRIAASQVVYACSFKVAALLPALASVLQPTVAQVLATAPTPPVFRIGLGVDWGSMYWRQTMDGTIVLGGGSQPLVPNGARTPYASRDGRNEETSGDLDGEEVEDDWLDPEIQRRLGGFFPRAFPDLPAMTIRQRWGGVMDHTRDNAPIVGPLAADPRRWVVAGFGGHGMPAGLGIGKAVAEGIARGQVPDIVAGLSPSRFEDLR